MRHGRKNVSLSPVTDSTLQRASRRARARLVWIGLVLLGLGIAAVSSWPALSRNLLEALEERSEQATATLFRLGELGSIEAELGAEYGVAADLAYETGSGVRVLRIAVSAELLPEGVPAEDKAREIAAFAIAKTAKAKHVDQVEVVFPAPGQSHAAAVISASGAHRFELGELLPASQEAPPSPPGPAAGI